MLNEPYRGGRRPHDLGRVIDAEMERHSQDEDFPLQFKIVPLEGVGPGEAVIRVQALGVEQNFEVRVSPDGS